MAGAVDLLLYGVAIFISPLAVYFKKGVGAQFWVNCCLYCLMGVPGAIHAFYIIHTNKHDKKSRQGSTHTPSVVVTQPRYSNLPSLPHPDRYRPPASYSPYEDHPPPLPPKQEEQERIPYDPALHPNATGAQIGRAKAVLHTYQIPDSTLHPPPLSQRSRRSNPSPEPPRPEARSTPRPTLQPGPRPVPQPPLQPEPQPEPESHPIASSSAPTAVSHTDAPTVAYPDEYHPNAEGRNIANAKAVLHTYQIPETTFPPPESEPEPEPAKRPKAATGTTSTKGSMWSLRSKGKGLASLDLNSPTEVPTPTGAPPPRGKWGAVSSGPSWLKRRKNRQAIPTGLTTTTEEDEPSTMTMVWDDRYESARTPGGGMQKHARTGSEPYALPFPMPPGSIRPVVDRTGTSNTILRQPLGRTNTGADGEADGEARLDAVDEDLTPRNERTLSEGEGAAEPKKARLESGRPETDTEASFAKAVEGRPGRTGGFRSKLVRRRPRLDTVGKGEDVQAPSGVMSAPLTNGESVAPVGEDVVPTNGATSEPVLEASLAAPEPSSNSPTWHRHIAPPALLASSIEEPRHGIFRNRHSTSPPSKTQSTPTSQAQPTSTSVAQQPRSSPPQQSRSSPQGYRSNSHTNNEIDFAMGEFGLGSAGDAYSAASRALQSRTRTTSSGAGRRLSGGPGPSPGPGLPPRQQTGSGGGRRVSVGTIGSPTPTSDVFSVPVISRGLTQGTFGTGMTKTGSSTDATSEESAGAQRPRLSPRGSSNSDGHRSENRTQYEEDNLSQDEQVERWIKNEDDKRQSGMALDGHSYLPDDRSQSHAHSSLGHVGGPDEASVFSEESSGFAGIGVGSAMEKGRAGTLDVWDQPGWDGSNPSIAGPAQTSKQSPQADSFRNPAAASASDDTHTSAYATGRESVSPVRRSPARPTRAPPAPPKPIRMGTFGAGSTTSFGLLSPPREPQRDKGKSPISAGSPPQHPASLMPARPPPVPSRPSGSMHRPQSPKLPPKPAVLRSMSTEDDDMSAVYVRALRDEI